MNKVISIQVLAGFLVLLGVGGCQVETQIVSGQGVKEPQKETRLEIPKNAKTMVVGGGCFWCMESLFDPLKGVIEAENGYAGGDPAGASYEQVSMGNTGHAEVIKVTFDPSQVSEEDLLKLFFTAHDPTTLNRQGPDSGTQYRSVIFYASPEEKALAEKVIKEVTDAKLWRNRIVTTVEPLKNYTRAEEYHQNYYEKYEKATPEERSHMNAGYCAAIIEPHVREWRKKLADKLKKPGSGG